MDAATAEMNELKDEVFRIIRGESKLSQSVLSEMLSVGEQKVYATSTRYREACEKVRDVDAVTSEMAQQLDQLKSWSALSDRAELPVKKMIASSIIERVTVYRDYKLEIKFNITYEQFIGSEGNKPNFALPMRQEKKLAYVA